jgi:outer membrane protein assembly factor BamB
LGANDPSGVIAIDKDGKRKWLFPIDRPDQIGASSPSIGLDGTIYIGAGNNLYAISQDGKEKWRFPTGGRIITCPLVDSNGTIYFGSYDENIYSVDANGSLVWIFPTDHEAQSSPALSPDGSIILTCYLDERILLALHANGTIKWSLHLDEIVFTNTPAIDEDGTIYVNGGFRNLYAINTNGTLKWVYPTSHSDSPDGHMVLCPAIGPDGTIYSGSIEGLFAINPDGTMKWRSRQWGTTRTPSVSGDGTIFARTPTGITAFRPDRTEKWTYEEEWALVTELVIGEEGSVYYYNQRELVALNGESEQNKFIQNPFFIVMIMILIVIILGIGLYNKKRKTKGWYNIERP